MKNTNMFIERIEASSPDKCWNWIGHLDRNGYGKYGGRLAHRLAWELFNERKIPDGMYVLHSCDNPRCCNPAHLRIGTQQDNMRDMVARGRMTITPRKLTVHDVKLIRSSGMSHRDVMETYMVCETHARNVVNGNRWGAVA